MSAVDGPLSFLTFAPNFRDDRKDRFRKPHHYDRTGSTQRHQCIWKPDGWPTDVLDGYCSSIISTKTFQCACCDGFCRQYIIRKSDQTGKCGTYTGESDKSFHFIHGGTHEGLG